MSGSPLGHAVVASIIGHLVLVSMTGIADRRPLLVVDLADVADLDTSEASGQPALEIALVEIEIDDEVGADGDTTSAAVAIEALTATTPSVSPASSADRGSRDVPVAPADGDSIADPAPRGRLAMRTTRDRDDRVRASFRADLDPDFGTPRPGSPPLTRDEPVSPPSELRRTARGDHETDLGTSIARVRPDGTVEIKDRPNVNIHLNLPDKRFVGALIRSWQKDPYKHAMGESEVELPTDSLAGGSFDTTDAIMRAIGDDPYLIKKLDFMDRTRDERAGIALKTKTEALADAARSARRALVRIQQSELAGAAKRALYFELWDECAEEGSESVLDASRAVRATIRSFVRKNLPEGTASAFTAGELERLNQGRSSSQRFDPYAKAL